MQPEQSAIEDIRKQFYANGKTVTDWAREHGFDRHLVYAVLNGRSRAQRGESHRIAVALGLKKAEPSELFSDSDIAASQARDLTSISKEVLMKT